MNHHKKTYENVFSSDDRPKAKVKLYVEKISVKGGMEVEEYTKLFKSFLNDFYSNLFSNCVKLSWMRRKFVYYNYETILPMSRNPRLLNIAFVKFLRRNVGKDIQIITRGKFFAKLELYFDDLFPGFEEGNPFTNPDYYKFPFENISLEYLMTVWQLDDRLSLLKEADKQKMTYAVFLDYIINHILSENEVLGRDRYVMSLNQDRNFPFWVKDTDKDLQARKGQKRKW